MPRLNSNISSSSSIVVVVVVAVVVAVVVIVIVVVITYSKYMCVCVCVTSILLVTLGHVIISNVSHCSERQRFFLYPPQHTSARTVCRFHCKGAPYNLIKVIHRDYTKLYC
jgi:hypothetical protein